MKKFWAILLAFAAACVMTGCRNASNRLGNCEFTKLHVDTYNYSGCFTIEKWYNLTGRVAAKTTEAGFVFLADGMYMLIEDDCPFCNEN